MREREREREREKNREEKRRGGKKKNRGIYIYIYMYVCNHVSTFSREQHTTQDQLFMRSLTGFDSKLFFF